MKQADDAIASFFAAAKTLGPRRSGDGHHVQRFRETAGRERRLGHRPRKLHADAGRGAESARGLYGRRPDLDTLDDTGNLVMEIPMQSVYASVLAQALRVDPAPILGGSYSTLPLFR